MSQPAKQTRIGSLDGLRGTAAIVVLLHHSILLNPAISQLYYAPASAGPAADSFAGIVTRTPLQLLVSGQEAVIVFFVLSGLVLTQSVLRSAKFDWLTYYPQRIVRLMLPVAASVLLAAAIILATPQNPLTAPSQWAADSSHSALDPGAVIRNIDVLSGDASLNNPLWSLRLEIIFSLLLPICVVIAIWARRHWILIAIASVATMAAGLYATDTFLTYVPGFVLGAALAVHLSAEREPRAVRPIWFVLALIGALLALETRWLFDSLDWDTRFPLGVAQIVSTFGAVALVYIAVRWSPLRGALESRFAGWLGKVSFSLYLVHVPIIIGIWAIIGAVSPGAPWWLGSIIAIPVALGVGWLFWLAVENPSHRLARKIGSRVRAARVSTVPEVVEADAAGARD